MSANTIEMPHRLSAMVVAGALKKNAPSARQHYYRKNRTYGATPAFERSFAAVAPISLTTPLRPAEGP